MFQWNFGDIMDGLATVLPQDAPAYIHGDRVITQGQADRRSKPWRPVSRDGWSM